MPRNRDDSKGQYSPITDYVAALKGDEFQELNKDKILKITRIAIAEIIGTAMFVGIGCGSLIVFPNDSIITLNVALSFSFAATLSIATFGHISGSFINPSLALTVMFLGKISFPMFIIYTLSECIGATLGLAAIKSITPNECINADFCLTQPHELVNVYKALLAEAFLTFCLCILLCSALDHRNQDKSDSVPIKFGVSIVALALVGGKYTGCSLNPARSFAPAFLSGNWNLQYVYWVGPLTGAALAGLLYQILFSESIPRQVETKETIALENSQVA